MSRDILELNSGKCKKVLDATSLQQNVTGKIFNKIFFVQKRVYFVLSFFLI
jgi:hypothetical protein